MNSSTKETISLTEQILSIINNTKEIVVYFVSIASSITYVVLTIIHEPLWASVFMGLAVSGIAIVLLALKKEQKSIICSNPNVIIKKEMLRIFVAPKYRNVKQQLKIQPIKKISEYDFKFFWTGSSQSVEIKDKTKTNVGNLSRIITPANLTFRWQLCRFVFHQPLERGAEADLAFAYHLPDPKKQANPFHMISYGHVKNCKHVDCEVRFEKGFKPKSVNLVYFDATGVAQKRQTINPIVLQQNTMVYQVSLTPQQNYKYSIEWEHK